ncbi:MAG: putative Ig domain-containing protein [Verrucomicrobiaceae bacterium]|nr:putative Ig domain-containing protein [Verrucomicrobiaceae bacterium]
MRKLLLLLAAGAAMSLQSNAATVNWAAGINHGFSLENGTELPVGSLVRIGHFRNSSTGDQLTDAEIQTLANTPSVLNNHFVEFGSSTIGSGFVSAPAGHFSASSTADTGSTGLNLVGKQMYIWVLNAASVGTATQHAILYWSISDTTSNPDTSAVVPGLRWRFPVQEPIPDTTTIDINDLTVGAGSFDAGARLLVGAYPVGTSTTTSADNFGLAAINSTPTITTSSPLPSGAVNTAYNATFAATGGSTPYTWDVSAGALPDGITLSSSGTLSGTPTEGGTFNFTVEVTDSSSASSTKAFVLNIAFPALSITTSSPLPNAFSTLVYSQTLAASGGDGTYSWTVSGGALPSGITLSGAGVLTGTPTVTGAFNFTAQVQDGQGTTSTKAFSLTVLARLITPVMQTPVFTSVVVGSPFTATLQALNYPKSFSVSGLPPGLVLNKTTGVISGKPTAPGVYAVQAKATNSAGTSPPVSAQLIVVPLSNNTVGTYLARVAPNEQVNSSIGGRIDLKTSITGGYSITLTMGTVTLKSTGSLVTVVGGNPAVDITLGGFDVDLVLDRITNLLSGTVAQGANSAAVSGWRKVWDKTINPASNRAGYYSMGIELASNFGVQTVPQGTGYATFAVGLDGSLTLAGKTSDGNGISCPGFIGPNGEILFYQPLYNKQSSMIGILTLSADPGGAFTENAVSGNVIWNKSVTTTGRVYTGLFGPLTLDVYGKYLARASKGSIVLGLPSSASTASLLFADGGLTGGVDASATNPDVAAFTFTATNTVVMPLAGSPANPGKAKLSINPASGLVTGEFTLTEASPALVRSAIKFYGVIVRPASGTEKAFGYFLVPQVPGVGQTIKTSPMLSGQVVISQ